MKYYLLSEGKLNHKLSKNKNESYILYSLNLRPYKTIVDGKEKNVCPFATSCVKICVGDNGHFSMKNGSAYKAQLRKTELYFKDPFMFYAQLLEDISKAEKQARKKNAIAVFRLNAYSDINHEKQSKRYLQDSIYKLFPNCLFYDYTKDKRKALTNDNKNYHLVYSYNEDTTKKELANILKRVNISVVFERVPNKFYGFNVLDGDKDDNRFLDDAGHIIGLKFKGSKAKLLGAISSGFCVPNA